MKDVYYWLEEFSYKMLKYHNKQFNKWCARFDKWAVKWKEKHGVEA